MGYIFDKYLHKKPEFSKSYLTRSYKSYMYDRTLSMFKYKNLPSTIPEEMFEYYLQHFGSCVITEVKGNLYALHGNYGGFIDPYYRPTLYIVANPALQYSAELKINEDCVFCTNDKLWTGLEPLISRYAFLIAENLITLRVANIMLRIVALLSAPDDKTKAEAERYLSNLVEGKLGIIGENRFFEGVKMQSPPSNNGSYLTQFIELHQYLLGTFYSEIGLKANFNMKREAIMAEESSLNDDVIIALVETMYQCRLSNVERINAKYGTDIKVSYAGEWLRNEIERSIDLVNAASQAGVDLGKAVSQLNSDGSDGGSGKEDVSQLTESSAGSNDGASDEPTGNEPGANDGATGNEPGASDVASDGSTGDESGSNNPTDQTDVINFNTDETTNKVLEVIANNVTTEKPDENFDEKSDEKPDEDEEVKESEEKEDENEKTAED